MDKQPVSVYPDGDAPALRTRRARAADRVGYLDVYASAVAGGGQWVSCALVCPALQTWVYIEQTEPPSALVDADGAWHQELRKVPHASFARGEEELMKAAREALARMCGAADGSLRLKPLLCVDDRDSFCQMMNVEAVKVRVRPGVAREFCRRIGMGSRRRPHALLLALELAVSDECLRHAMSMEEITRLELLLGTKNAQSMRAWMRRRAAVRRAPRRADGAGQGERITPAASV